VTSTLRDQHLVAYVFGPLTGEHRDRAHGQLCAAWGGIASKLGLTEGADLGSDDWASPGRVARRWRTGGVLGQAFWDNVGDVACVSVAFSLACEPDSSWLALHQRWESILDGAGTDALLGMAVVLTARIDGEDAASPGGSRR
jgi:hypothetical protein